jgi:hypothetical protein
MAKAKAIVWTTGLVVKTFNLDHIYKGFYLLEDVMTVENDLTVTDIEMLDYRREQLTRNVNGWNEETLKMKFIAFILDMARYDIGKLQGVFETEMSAVVQGYSLKVITDFTVAKVIEDYIDKPYFYFHEYKQKKNAKDPAAQVLLAMLIAQEHNQDGKPIYGCHVIGELWHFMVMQGNEYAMHKGLNATEPDDLQQILLILRKIKHILLKNLMD